MDPDAGTNPDLDAIAADLAGIETTLDELAVGSYRHDADADHAQAGAETDPPAS